MFALPGLLIAFALQGGLATAKPTPRGSSPTVQLDSATFTGASSGRLSKFLGIPFAQPPIGDRRFRLPEPLPPYTGSQSATSFGPSCPQQAFDLPFPEGLLDDVVDSVVNTVYKAITPDSEDCLSLNVWAPESATSASKLPVVVWIFGGGFEIGSTSTYDGGVIVERSIQLGQPVVYVSMNYRLNAFGFLASQEVKDAGLGNFGLHDQRAALRWVQKYIAQFGGDPTKVTIWGESAGAVSAALHMVSNNGNNEGLFRGAFMESGSPIPVGDISHGQQYYDFLVADTGCSGAPDSLACLRAAPYLKLKVAIDKTPSLFSYQSLVLAWLPRTDGIFLTDSPQRLVQQGKVANVPFVTGDCDDEGSLFAFSTLNITTTAQLRAYIRDFWIPTGTDADIERLSVLYPEDPTQGSPYNTGFLNVLTPQSKRIASFQGDAIFHAPRRFFLQARSAKQHAWSFLNRRLKSVPFLGSFHGSDLLNVYSAGDMADYLIHFVATQDPNGKPGIFWPRYTTASPNLLTFNDDLLKPLSITQDTFRKDAIDFMMNVTFANPL